jgi:hypothetical protein
MLRRLKQPEFWVAASMMLATPGAVCAAIGRASGTRWLYWTGLGLCVPGAIAVALLLVVVFPVLIIANRRQR